MKNFSLLLLALVLSGCMADDAEIDFLTTETGPDAAVEGTINVFCPGPLCTYSDPVTNCPCKPPGSTQPPCCPLGK
jgi:hypothetical protein